MGSSQTTGKMMAVHMDRLALYLEATQMHSLEKEAVSQEINEGLEGQ
jgi:hypothetical protein